MSLISVVIPVVGRNQFIGTCLKSVFNSTYRKLEVIIVSDYIEEIKKLDLDEYREKIKYIEFNDESLVKARNKGLKHCSGDLIALMDVKDVTGKMRIELEVTKLNQSEDTGMVFCGTTFIDDNGNFMQGFELFTEFDKNKFAGMMFEKNRIKSISTTLVKRKVIEEIGLFDETLQYESEYDYWLRIASMYPVEYLDLPLLRRRINNEDYFNMRESEIERGKVLLKHDIREIAQSLSRVYDNEEDFRISLGSILYRMGKKDEALKNFKKVLTINSRNDLAYFTIGNFYINEGKFKEAQNCFKELLMLNPGHAECRNNLGVLLYREGKKEGSIEEFEKAKRLKKDYVDPLFNLKCTLDKKSYEELRITIT